MTHIIYLKPAKIRKLKQTISDNESFLVGNSNWLKRLAAVDRIEDIANGLNSKDFHIGPNEPAFEFCEFLGQSFVMIDTIFTLAGTISKECESELMMRTSGNTITVGNDKKVNDYRYMKYIRALFSEHPLETNQHKECSSVEEWCGCVVWTNKGREVQARIYDADGKIRLMRISVEEVCRYVYSYYSQLEMIEGSLKDYVRQKNKKFGKKEMKGLDDFNGDPKEFLRYMSREDKKRMSRNWPDIDLCVELLEINVSQEEEYKRFKEYILKAAVFEQNRIQDTSALDYSCRGVSEGGTSLLNEIMHPSEQSACIGMDTIWKDLYLLNKGEDAFLGTEDSSPADLQLAKSQRAVVVGELRREIFSRSEFFNRYVHIHEQMSDSELYFMIHLARLLEAMELNPQKYSELNR